MLWLEQPYSNRCGVVAFAMHLPGRSNVQEVLSAKASWTGVGSGGLRGPRGPTGPRPRDVSATRSIQISQDILSPPLYISYLHSKYVDVVKTNSRPSWFFLRIHKVMSFTEVALYWRISKVAWHGCFLTLKVLFPKWWKHLLKSSAVVVTRGVAYQGQNQKEETEEYHKATRR